MSDKLREAAKALLDELEKFDILVGAAKNKVRAALAAEEVSAKDAERLAGQLEAITDLNHGQFLQLEYLRPIHAAAVKLYMEAEEYDFPDGLGQGAPQDLWDALADALEPKTEAIKEEIAAHEKEPR